MTDSDSRPAGEAAIHRSGDQKHDVTQTFGHDSDLSFVPFGVELTDVEQTAIAALPSGSALLLVRSGALAGARYLLDTDVTTVGLGTPRPTSSSMTSRSRAGTRRSPAPARRSRSSTSAPSTARM